MELLSRKDAIVIGSPSYFNGLPCHKGHIALRRTVDGSCRGCRKEKSKARLKARRVEIRDALAKFRAEGV